MLAMSKYIAILSNVFALKRTVAGKVELPRQYWLTIVWDFHMFSWLFGHVSATINWEPLTATFLTVARMEHVEQLFNKIMKDDP